VDVARLQAMSDQANGMIAEANAWLNSYTPGPESTVSQLIRELERIRNALEKEKKPEPESPKKEPARYQYGDKLVAPYGDKFPW
jgi:hypothetical protein